MSTALKSQGKAMYVASELDKSWLLSEQKKLYERSLRNPDYVFCKLRGLVSEEDVRGCVRFGRGLNPLVEEEFARFLLP